MYYAPFVVIDGPIGVGKSSLAEILGEKLGWKVGFESVTDNPFLSDFYKNPSRWAFQLNTYFMVTRQEQYLWATDNRKPTVLDRSIHGDLHIFMKYFLMNGDISERDYVLYVKLFNAIMEKTPIPDLMIYLTAPVDTLMGWIKKRGRGMEKAITREYMVSLSDLFGVWIPDFDLCPILTINTGNMPFIDKEKHLDTIIPMITEKLGWSSA